MPQVSIVVPLYNEEEIFPRLVKRLNELIEKSPFSVEVVLVDDGSEDRTAQLMGSVALQDERYKCIFLSRNHGHQLALTAGLANVSATEAVLIIDGDLQDPPELIKTFYERFKEGYDVVYAVRKKRKEGVFKRLTYWLYYRISSSISYYKIPLDSGDFSLISRKVVDILNKMPEESRYIRGMRSWVGFKQIGIEYERDRRAAGETKYSIRKLVELAFTGIFNFSNFPIKFIIYLGTFSIVISLIYLLYTLIQKLFYDNVPQGFTAILFVIVLFSGVQLVSLGVIGEYVLRVFFQVKQRPLFIVKNKIVNKEYIDG
ncbi:MAG TPA: glycosyltransferase family 2 protein [Thermodesulfobacteriota bacterium]|nr:glycosyltransferase family 2 protein [Thermodesulfobacteriota bacterium]